MKKCDLVMKGGISSGIVYPRAVLELSKEFEFANIGGTSAGAIAAALTAAAELRRQRDGSTAGFDALAKLPDWMAGQVDGRSRLLRLFEPAAETAPLFEAALAFIEKKGSKLAKLRAAVAAIVRRCRRFGSIAACIGVALMILIGGSTAPAPAPRISAGIVILALAVLTTGAVVAASVIEALVAAHRSLPREGFGICSGLALTEWLANEIDATAGVETPLTFGDLRAAGIRLEMMTTNLTHGRPYRLPLEGKRFFFRPDEMQRLFPDRIVRWMIDHAGKERRGGLYALPLDALPVVFATRMSLSFPILLSAVPLWARDFGRRTDSPEPERCWFSDGGITSNFPVHFFDASIPRWPTFAINLAERTARYHADGQRIYVPRTNRGGILEWWSPFASVFGFVGAIVNTMQNWRDNMLLHLPGQRDRIAHVLLAEDEGGMNLSMDAGTIRDVAGRGAEAGRVLRERFGSNPPPEVTLTWANHKWVRFLSFMGALETALESWQRALDDKTEPPSFHELVSGAAPLPSYRISPADRHAMSDASTAFLRHVRETFGARPFRRSPRRPKPEPVLRAMPGE